MNRPHLFRMVYATRKMAILGFRIVLTIYIIHIWITKYFCCYPLNIYIMRYGWDINGIDPPENQLHDWKIHELYFWWIFH